MLPEKVTLQNDDVRLMENFKQFDLNGDGWIDESELLEAMRGLGTTLV